MKRAAQLLALQELEADIDDKTERLERVQAALRGSRELARARKAYEQAQTTVERLEPAQRERELALKSLEEELDQKEQHLYSGQVKNPKELEAYQRDIQQLKRRRSKLDEEVLRGMDELDTARSALAQAEARLNEAEAAWKQRKAELTDLRRKLKRYILRARKKREALRDKIAPGDLAFYEETVQRKNGIAVAELKGMTCGICGVGVSHGKADAVRHRDELIVCGNCERILVAA